MDKMNLNIDIMYNNIDIVHNYSEKRLVSKTNIQYHHNTK